MGCLYCDWCTYKKAAIQATSSACITTISLRQQQQRQHDNQPQLILKLAARIWFRPEQYNAHTHTNKKRKLYVVVM